MYRKFEDFLGFSKNVLANSKTTFGISKNILRISKEILGISKKIIGISNKFLGISKWSDFHRHGILAFSSGQISTGMDILFVSGVKFPRVWICCPFQGSKFPRAWIFCLFQRQNFHGHGNLLFGGPGGQISMGWGE